MPSEYDVSNYKILPHVNDDNDDVLINQVDFKRDLQSDVALNKKLTRSVDGRPKVAEYFYNDVLMAKIYFYFILDATGLITRRTEHLHYIKNDDSENSPITIKDKTYNFADPTDFAFVIKERQMGREAIIDEIKAVLLLTLSAANPTYTVEQVVGLGVPFFDEMDVAIKHFIDLGMPDFKDALLAIDLLTTDHDWLNIEVASDVDLRDYMVSKLTYTAVSNHPDA